MSCNVECTQSRTGRLSRLETAAAVSRLASWLHPDGVHCHRLRDKTARIEASYEDASGLTDESMPARCRRFGSTVFSNCATSRSGEVGVTKERRGVCRSSAAVSKHANVT